ncbi:helix-turn-helix domain-containing protein [Modicisalibacter tunisiensis]|uniref:helix-turn-helix domain-containing protein n=2 Tax=Modicisalibacter tunisiensis TaxID=390637 RepID=UPI0029621F53|nr:helix-turn-helix domain-containing protein [Modicisalibacter tunisiensis]
MQSMDALGSRIKALRLKANLSKAALARRVGVSDVTISYWESGTIRQIGHERLLALADALDCTLADLLEDTPAPSTPMGILALHAREAAPWERHDASLISLLGELPLARVDKDCHLITPGPGERFDFLDSGDLAAIRPLETFQEDGLYLVAYLDRLAIRRLDRTPSGELRIAGEHGTPETLSLAALPFRLLGQLRARWQLRDA